MACLKGNVTVVALLAERGADLTSPDKSGVTPLWLALRHGRPRTALALLRHGARPGKTVLILLALALVGCGALVASSLRAGGLHMVPHVVHGLSTDAAHGLIKKANALL